MVLRVEITNPSRGRLMAIILLSLDSALRIRFRLYHPFVCLSWVRVLGRGRSRMPLSGSPVCGIITWSRQLLRIIHCT